MLSLLLILFSVVVGFLLGVFTGLTPGIHINLLASLILVLINNPTVYVLVAIFSMAVTHTFVDIIPSVYLGAPDEAMSLNVLPAHRLLLKGKGHEAVLISLMGSFFGLLFVIVSFPFIIFMLKFLVYIKQFFKYGILILVLFLIFRERNKIVALIVFLLSGILGVMLLDFSSNAFYHLFSGFFGVAMLFSGSSKIPKQNLNGKGIINPKISLYSLLSGIFTGIFPGTTNSTGALLFPVRNESMFLYYVSGINTVSMIVGLATFYVLDKARNGIIIVIQKILNGNIFTLKFLVLFLLVSILSSSLAVLISLFLSKKIIFILTRINYNTLRKIIIFILIFLSFVFDSYIGLIAIITSTSLSLIAQDYGLKRSLLLGCLLFPLLLFYFL